MEEVPDIILAEILTYLPPKSYLPIAIVSKKFRGAWFDCGRLVSMRASSNSPVGCSWAANKTALLTVWATDSHSRNAQTLYETSPLQVGNLFDTPWNSNVAIRGCLRTSLLEYYISSGWEGDSRIRLVLLGAAARGDIDGLSFLADKGHCRLDDIELCTIAGAAGRLEALRWLREVHGCPWDPTEVFREASENLQNSVMTYVEMNCGDHEIQTHYGVGLPW